MSDYIGSDIGVIINILKLISYPYFAKDSANVREILFNYYYNDITGIVSQVDVNTRDIVSVIHNHQSTNRLKILSRLMLINQDQFDSYQLILLVFILGLLSSVPNDEFVISQYDSYFYKKLKSHNLNKLHQKTDNRSVSLKNIIRELNHDIWE